MWNETAAGSPGLNRSRVYTIAPVGGWSASNQKL